MKILKLITLIFLCSTVFLNKIYAQGQDYVITKNNDTIYCSIVGAYKYRVYVKDKFTKIDTNIIQYFVAKDTANFVLKKIPKEKFSQFVRWLQRGSINLYERRVPAGNYIIPYWYASKGNNPLVLIKATGLLHVDDIGTRDERKKAFIDLFSDTPTLFEKFKYAIKGDYDFDIIQSCIQQYNNQDSYINEQDYVITKKNDTILCKIKYDIASGQYMFKAKNKNDFVKIDGADINQYFYSRENITFKLQTLPQQSNREFVKWLEKGNVNLFERTKLTGDANNATVKYYWYVNKGTGPLIPIKIDAKPVYDIRSHKEQLNAFINIISDNKALVNEFRQSLRNIDSNTDAIICYYINKYNGN